MNPSHVDSLVEFFESIRSESVADFPRYYSEEAFFKDPFNEVRGVSAIQRIFTHMFSQVAEPRFKITERVVDDGGAMLVWEFHYRVAIFGREQKNVIRGASHLKFNGVGKVYWHRDYWDAAEELYARLPLVGWFMRGLKKIMASQSGSP